MKKFKLVSLVFLLFTVVHLFLTLLLLYINDLISKKRNRIIGDLN